MPTIPRSMGSPCSRFPGGFRRLGYLGFAPAVSRIAGVQYSEHAKRHSGKAFVEIGGQVRRSQVDLLQLGSPRGERASVGSSLPMQRMTAAVILWRMPSRRHFRFIALQLGIGLLASRRSIQLRVW